MRLLDRINVGSERLIRKCVLAELCTVKKIWLWLGNTDKFIIW